MLSRASTTPLRSHHSQHLLKASNFCSREALGRRHFKIYKISKKSRSTCFLSQIRILKWVRTTTTLTQDFKSQSFLQDCLDPRRLMKVSLALQIQPTETFSLLSRILDPKLPSKNLWILRAPMIPLI
jgi:hypothetical protein